MTRTHLVSLAVSFIALAACGKSADGGGPREEASRAGAAASELDVGSPAPAVTFRLTDGSELALESLVGSKVLVYFYPKDDTPGCTVQAEGIRDRYEDLAAAGLKVFGVSTQDAASHRAFIDKYELPFPLVVDTDGSVAAAFGVPVENGVAMRQSFLIGADGKIAHLWRRVSPASHVADVLEALQ